MTAHGNDSREARRIFAQVRFLATVVWLFGVCPGVLHAERFLTVTQAQVLCYAEADRFEARTVVLDEAQVKAIEAASQQKVLTRGHRTWVAWRGTNLLGVIFFDQVPGEQKPIDYVVAISPAGAVHQVEILEHREHPGSDLRGAKWRGQFKGKTAKDRLRVGEEVEDIPDAPIACRNLTGGIRRVLVTFDLVVRPALPAAPDPGPRRVPFATPRGLRA